MRLVSVLTLLWTALASSVLALPLGASLEALEAGEPPRLSRSRALTLFAPHPVVVWHGLGDSAYSEWLARFKAHLEAAYPGIFVYILALAPTPLTDQRASVLGNVNEQVRAAHEQLAQLPELRHGFDAIGFSQGGQFLRAYVERYNAPRVRNLVTFGSQHMGIADLPGCSPSDFLCHKVHELLRSKMYGEYAQSNVVIAQYFRDTSSIEQFAKYHAVNSFLHDINNEGAEKNLRYKERLSLLQNFVMVRFDEDKTVVPSASAWFGAFEDPDRRSLNSTNGTIVPLRNSRLYREDWLGLRVLDERGAIKMHTCHGVHMQLSDECLVQTLGPYIGQPRSLLVNHMQHAAHCPMVRRIALPFIALAALALVIAVRLHRGRPHDEAVERK